MRIAVQGLSIHNNFWSRVAKCGPFPHKKAVETYPEIRGKRCWIWTAGRSHGYGYFWNTLTQTSVYAHRYAYELMYGTGSFDSKLGCHKCDNPLCVRPLHQFRGTRVQNVNDMVAKGRHYRKLSLLQVRGIRSLRSLNYTIKQLACMFDVSSGHVAWLCRRTKSPRT